MEKTYKITLPKGVSVNEIETSVEDGVLSVSVEMARERYMPKDGDFVTCGNDINFPVAYVMEKLLKDYGCLCIVTFWQEIDRGQWERVNELINKERNDDKRCIGCFGT